MQELEIFSDRNRRKQYAIGPLILLWILNWKSYSCHVRWPWVTLKGRTRGPFSWQISARTNSDQIRHANPPGEGISVTGDQPRPSAPDFGTSMHLHTVWPGVTKFGIITRLGGACLWGRPAVLLNPRRRGPMALNFSWDPTYCHTVWPRSTKFGKKPTYGKRHVYGRMWPRKWKGRGTSAPHFWTPTYANMVWYYEQPALKNFIHHNW